MADTNDFMIDEDLFEFDDFITKKARAKLKNKLNKVKNTLAQKLPPKLKDKLLRPTSPTERSSSGTSDRAIAKSDPRTCEEIVKDRRAKLSQMNRLMGRVVRMQHPRIAIEQCKANRGQSNLVPKANLSNLTKIGIPPSVVAKLKDVEKKGAAGIPLKNEEVDLVEEINETISPVTDQMELDVATASVGGSEKKPPYILYGAIGLIALIIGYKVIKG